MVSDVTGRDKHPSLTTQNKKIQFVWLLESNIKGELKEERRRGKVRRKL